MGYIRHNAMIVTGGNYEEAKVKFNMVYQKATELFGYLVSEVISAKTNGYHSFFIAPDGSKENRDISDEYDKKRKQLANFINSLAYDDGSNGVSFVDVGFDEDFCTKIDRQNKKKRII